MRYWLVLPLVLLMLAPLVQASPVGDSVYFSMDNDSIQCMTIVLPDDMGAILPGKIEYTLNMVPGPYETWSDLSEQVVRTDENNTAVIPICFSTYGKRDGDSASPFTLTIEAPGLPTKVVQGGVAVSDYPDVDMGVTSVPEGQTVQETLSSNLDNFDLAFDKTVVYAVPGESVSLTLRVSSYADMALDVNVESDMLITPETTTVSLSPQDNYDAIDYTITAPQEVGEYELTALASVQGCAETFCSKGKKATLVVLEEEQALTGWRVSVFPENINIKSLGLTYFLLEVRNSGPPADFTVSADLPEGVEGEFTPQDIGIGRSESAFFDLYVTPLSSASLYEIVVSVTSGELTKTVTGYLSTDEMFTDALREAEAIVENTTDTDVIGDVSQSIDDFYQEYTSIEHGQENQAYSNLKSQLDSSKQAAQTTQPPGGDIAPPPFQPAQPAQEIDWLFIIIPIIGVVVVAVLVFFWYRGKKSSKGPELETSFEGEQVSI